MKPLLEAYNMNDLYKPYFFLHIDVHRKLFKNMV